MLALSVMDQSPIPRGSTSVDAINDTVALAIEAERLGYRRMWLAEHHNTRSMASTAPEVLAAHIASRTSVIRVGSGGVLLSHYSALKVAEAFRTLETLFPGRIDLGLGRADGADLPAVKALHDGGETPSDEQYAQRLANLVGYLDGADPGGVAAMPAPPGAPEVWVLGSSSVGAGLAARLGLPFCFAHFVSPTFGEQVMEGYRRQFQPSARYPRPRASLGVTAICASSDDRAEELATSGDVWHLKPEGGRRGPLLPAEEAASYPVTALEHELIAQHLARRITGAPDRVAAVLTKLAAAYEVDEVVVRTVCHDPNDRLESYRLLAAAFSLAAAC